MLLLDQKFVISLSWLYFNLSRINDFFFLVMELIVVYFRRKKYIDFILYFNFIVFECLIFQFINVSGLEIELYDSKVRC